ncbi:MAG: hypothetical protein AAF662_06815 [Pseudomonadota bacterium]
MNKGVIVFIIASWLGMTAESQTIYEQVDMSTNNPLFINVERPRPVYSEALSDLFFRRSMQAAANAQSSQTEGNQWASSLQAVGAGTLPKPETPNTDQQWAAYCKDLGNVDDMSDAELAEVLERISQLLDAGEIEAEAFYQRYVETQLDEDTTREVLEKLAVSSGMKVTTRLNPDAITEQPKMLRIVVKKICISKGLAGF